MSRELSKQSRSTIVKNSLHPAWQQTLTLTAWLPETLVHEEALLQVWDDDFGPNGDDFMGLARLPLIQAGQREDGVDGAEPMPERQLLPLLKVEDLIKAWPPSGDDDRNGRATTAVDDESNLANGSATTAVDSQTLQRQSGPRPSDLATSKRPRVLLSYELRKLPNAPEWDRDASGVPREAVSPLEPPAPSVTPMPKLTLKTRAVQMRCLVHRCMALNGDNSAHPTVRTLGLCRPFLTFTIDERAGSGSGLKWRSETSRRPNAKNPLYAELIDQTITLPTKHATASRITRTLPHKPSST